MEQGQCVRIFTGAPMPIGADAVIMQEQATAVGNQISFDTVPRLGQSIRRQGMDFTRGEELLAAGVTLTPAMLNLAATANQPTLTVTRRPRLALLATGDELVAPGTPLGPDQIVASNSYGLVPLLGPYAEKVIDLGIVPDDKKKLEQALLGAFDYGIDVLVTTGGASVGERDYVREVLIDLGVRLDFWKLRMRPGKPLMFGTRGATLVFGLPGNPVSSMVTAMVILRPALRQMTGHADPFWPQLGVPLALVLSQRGSDALAVVREGARAGPARHVPRDASGVQVGGREPAAGRGEQAGLVAPPRADDVGVADERVPPREQLGERPAGAERRLIEPRVERRARGDLAAGRDDELQRLAGRRAMCRPLDELVTVSAARAQRVGPRVGFAGDAHDVVQALAEDARHAESPRAVAPLRVPDARAVEPLLAADLEVDHRAERREQRREAVLVALERGQRVHEGLDRRDRCGVRLLADAVLARRGRDERVARERREHGIRADDLLRLRPSRRRRGSPGPAAATSRCRSIPRRDRAGSAAARGPRALGGAARSGSSRRRRGAPSS